MEAIRTGLETPLLVNTHKELGADCPRLVALSAAGPGDVTCLEGCQVQDPGLGLHQGGGLRLHGSSERGGQALGALGALRIDG